MATAGFAQTGPKLSFPGPIGTKRRRMRSGGGSVSTQNNQQSPPQLLLEDLDELSADGKTTQTTSCRGATTIPLFLKKTYKMIDTCDPAICSWSEDGETFTVKDADIFAAQVIPQYFDHNKFSSFARQLNFYGFRKMQSKPIKNSDFDAGSAKHITFYNENFKRGRCDLLKKIQRSTRGGGSGAGQDQTREIQQLKDQVNALEDQLTEMSGTFEDRLRRLEMDMLARMEQMMMAMQQQQQLQQQSNLQLQSQTSIGTNASGNHLSTNGSVTVMPMPLQQQIQHQSSLTSHQLQVLTQQQPWEPDLFAFPGRTASVGINSLSSFQQPQTENKPDHPATGATLPPHPKQKSLPVNTIFAPGGMNQRLSSLRGISTLSRGLSGLSRGPSIESTASGSVMKSSWDDKLFSMLMLGENGQAADPMATAAALGLEPNSLVAPILMQANQSIPSQSATNVAPPTVVSEGSMVVTEGQDMNE